MKRKYLILLLCGAAVAVICSVTLYFVLRGGTEGRTVLSLNGGWNFSKDEEHWEAVSVPHTWNTEDGQDGGSDYDRGRYCYTRTVSIPFRYRGSRIYLEFQGAALKTEVFVNGKLVGTHKGGYTTFRFDITDCVRFVRNNEITVYVDNSQDKTIAPLAGDFTVFGGIYRDVSLIVTNPVHVDLLDDGSCGVFLKTEDVGEQSADLIVETTVVNDSGEPKRVTIAAVLREPDEFTQSSDEARYILRTDFDRDTLYQNGRIVERQEEIVTIEPGGSYSFMRNMTVDHPHLWNGRMDPYLYYVDVSVLSEDGETVLDQVHQTVGFRYYEITKEGGFFLNGASYPLRGVAKHQDWEDMGYAITKKELTVDFSLLYEIGANAVRLSHYPHDSYFYELCDKYGIVVYTEIPLVNYCGGSGSFWEPDDVRQEFIDVTANQLKELIKQQYNRASIVVWGLHNEANVSDPEIIVPLISYLNDLAKELDPSRYTTTATFLVEGELIGGDLLSWNIYSMPHNLGTTIDERYQNLDGSDAGNHKRRYGESFDEILYESGYYDGVLDRPVGLSEYGVGGDIGQHVNDPALFAVTSKFQPEEYQAYCHENWVVQLKERPYLWGAFVWNLFDFSSDTRDEATEAGVNTKGLITRDRKTKKDAFYLYKSHWSREDVVYITSKNNSSRWDDPDFFKVYSNCESVELFLNDVSLGVIRQEACSLENVFVWPCDVELPVGETYVLKAVGIRNGETCQDSLSVSKVLSSVTDVRSGSLKIDLAKRTIGISGGLTVDNIGSQLDGNGEISFSVKEADGKTDARGYIQPGMKLLVTAADGVTTSVYTFVVADVAQGAVISVPGAETGNGPERLCDGDYATRWAYASNGRACPIVLDFGGTAVFDSITITWYGDRAYYYSIYTSLDGVNYELLMDRKDNTRTGTTLDLFDPAEGRYVKILVQGNSAGSGWVSVYEISVHGWAFKTPEGSNHRIDYDNQTIQVWKDGVSVIAKEDFIGMIGLTGTCTYEFINDAGGAYFLSEGDVLQVSFGNRVSRYTILLSS